MNRLQRALMIAGVGVLLSIPALVSYRIGVRTGKREAIDGLEARIDTIYRIKAITAQNSPVLSVRMLPSVPVVLAVHDTTVREVDSARIILDFVQKQHADPDGRFTAWVSGPQVAGYGPQLDSIRLTVPERVVTQTVIQERRIRPRYSVGIGVGYGLPFTTGAEIRPAPYIGVTLQYNLLSFGWKQ